ncbi:conserved hypothetical protein [uncultured spirochete]|jgi:hypothetical protein|uniref:Integrase catalytic domain-containing protein n=1 Tax=uncultured spirochete TaxID=156406 RepID=A0A3P3XSH7_9SPIR|nr:conserved hypothetical protein [uncultured spirochete]
MAGELAMGEKELIRAKVMEQVVQQQLTLKEAEKLRECHGIEIDHETLRRWLRAAGLWERERRGSPCCLMNMVDDATGITFSFFCEEETTSDAMRLLWRWIEQYGIPQALYCDKKNAFVLTREPTIAEQLERNHGVYQDRLIKELRLAGISTIEEATRFLREVYLPKINTKFAKTPAQPEDAHVPLIHPTSLEDILCYETPRVVSNDYVVSYKCRPLQMQRHNRLLPTPKAQVTVRELLDGRIKLLYHERELEYVELEKPFRKEELASRSA